MEKELNWKLVSDPEKTIIEAQTPFGVYRIEIVKDKVFAFSMFYEKNELEVSTQSIYAAKEVCAQDWKRRISDSTYQIGAVLSYYAKNGACEYAHIFFGDPIKSYNAAFSFLKKISDKKIVTQPMVMLNHPNAVLLGTQVIFHHD